MLKFLYPRIQHVVSFRQKKKKFFPGRQVPFVKVSNIEREIIADEIITKKSKYPFKVVLAKNEDFEPIMDFILEDFVKEEPICRSIGAKPDELRPIFSDLISECINSKLTMLALDSENHIICSQNSRCFDFSDVQKIENFKFQPKNDYGVDIDNGKYMNRKCNQYYCFYKTLYPLLPHYIADESKVLGLLFTAVHPGYTNKGIGKFVALKVMERAKLEGFNYGASLATSKYAIKMAESAGYTKSAILYYSDFLDHGKRVFSKVPELGTEAALLCKKL